MTTEERAAVRETVAEGHSAALKAILRAKADGDLDGRLIAIAATEVDKAFAVVLLAVDAKVAA
jgi:hypothetical protein